MNGRKYEWSSNLESGAIFKRRIFFFLFVVVVVVVFRIYNEILIGLKAVIFTQNYTYEHEHEHTHTHTPNKQ